MGQQTLSWIGLSFVLVATAGVLAMLELWGNDATRFNKTVLKWTHRTCGYLFIAIYAVMMWFMLKRIAQQTEPLSAVQSIHTSLAILIFPLLLVKILILRRFSGLSEKLPYLGISIFAIAFTLNAMTAGFYLLRSANARWVSLQFFDRSRLNSDVGRGLLEARCQKCHSLERVFTSIKTEEEWTKTVNTMMLRDPAIPEDEGAQIIFYLSTGRSVKPNSQVMMLSALHLTDTKCGRCHMLERIYRERRTREEWTTIVKRMSDIEPLWITAEDAAVIRDYLITAHGLLARDSMKTSVRKGQANAQDAKEHPPAPAEQLTADEIFQTRCTECHDHDRVYKKARDIGSDPDKWRIIVERMKKNGAVLGDSDIPKMISFLSVLDAAKQ